MVAAMEILRMGEAVHGQDFRVLRENGYPHYLLLLTKTPALFECGGKWVNVQAGTAFLFRPGQRHSYRAAGESYADCWMHAAAQTPLLFEEFPFAKPVPLHSAERFFALFRIIEDEFFAERRTRESVVRSLTSALLEMLASEIEVRGPLFYPFLSFREALFSAPARAWRAEDAAKELGVSCGYFHALYKKFFRTTFIADLVAARIQAAEELLLSTPESIERVAERCGYMNTEHFIRQFKQATGVSPLRYRKGQN